MLKPTGEWILTKPLEKDEKVTQSGLVLVTKQQDAVKLVEIISFGPDANTDLFLSEGEVVMVPQHTGLKIEHEDEEYEMAKQENFLGVIE